MRYVLGIGYPVAHDSNAALLNDKGEILFAASEERFSRIKKDGKIPYKTLKHIKDYHKSNPTITQATYPCKRVVLEKGCVNERNKVEKNFNYLVSKLPSPIVGFLYQMQNYAKFKEFVPGKKIPKLKKVAMYCGHHDSHAASAYYTSGFKKSLVITYDGGIDCEPWLCSVQEGNNGELKRYLVGRNRDERYKAGWMYSGITKLLGFRPGRHEGKITGLAAFGKYNEKCINELKEKMKGKPGKFFYHEIQDKLSYLLQKYSREDLSYAVQYIAEKNVEDLLSRIKENLSYDNVSLAGGIFANVRINQKVKESGFKNIFIHPGMGDEGVGVGSALSYLGKRNKLRPYKLRNVYFGLEYSEKQIKKALEDSNVKYSHTTEIEGEVAELISKGKVVARFNGRMEYGPRALGNRSILYQATDPKVNDWLNKRLHRCYDEKTEVLTNKGWKFIKDVEDNEIVATLNQKKNKLEFQKIIDNVSYFYEGAMYKIKNNRVDLLVTPGHNMLVKRKHSNKFKLEKIDEIFKIKTLHYQKKSGTKWSGKNQTYFTLPSIKKNKKIIPSVKMPMGNWLKFFGFWLSEGSKYFDGLGYGRGHYRVTVAQSKKSRYFKEIEQCLKKLPFKFRYDTKEFITCSKQLYCYLSQFGKAPEKFVPRELLELNKENLLVLFDSLMKGDGNIRGTGFRYATTSKKLANDVQELSLKLGLSAYVSIQKAGKSRHRDLYMVRIGKSEVATIRKNQISKVHYFGKVYCVSVPNKIIFVRRNGKSLFCGNTEFMPFAPVTLEEFSKKCYKNLKGAEHATKFMTITFDCTDYMKKNSPAVVHVDGTARPQIISKKDNPSYYKIVKEYYKITKLPSIVNTSFNMHEEPIVCSPNDAIRSFQLGHLDYLAIGNFLVKNK